jgi:hypothetical protein
MAESPSTGAGARADVPPRHAAPIGRVIVGDAAYRKARLRDAVRTGIGIGLACAVVLALVAPTPWCLVAPLGGGLLGAFYAKAPTATDALIERAESIHGMRDGSRG